MIFLSLAKVLLQKNRPERAQLGLKTIHQSLPPEISDRIKEIYNQTSTDNHHKAVKDIVTILKEELEWMEESLPKLDYTIPFLKRMLKES